MNDTLIINGITYKAVKEEKKPERLEGWAWSESFKGNGLATISKNKSSDYYDTRMIEISSGEIIVSKDAVAEAWRNTFSLAPSPQQSEMFALFLKYLGFKKDGAECGK